MDKQHLEQQAQLIYEQWEVVERAKLQISAVRFGNEPKSSKKRDTTDLIADSEKLAKKYWELCNTVEPKTCCTVDKMCDGCKFKKPVLSLNDWDQFIRWVLIKCNGFATVNTLDCSKFESAMNGYGVDLQIERTNSYRTVYKFSRKT